MFKDAGHGTMDSTFALPPAEPAEGLSPRCLENLPSECGPGVNERLEIPDIHLGCAVEIVQHKAVKVFLVAKYVEATIVKLERSCVPPSTSPPLLNRGAGHTSLSVLIGQGSSSPFQGLLWMYHVSLRATIEALVS